MKDSKNIPSALYLVRSASGGGNTDEEDMDIGACVVDYGVGEKQDGLQLKSRGKTDLMRYYLSSGITSKIRTAS